MLIASTVVPVSCSVGVIEHPLRHLHPSDLLLGVLNLMRRCRVGDSNLSLEAPSPPATPSHARRPPLPPQPDDTPLRTMVGCQFPWTQM